jgi:predicted phage terminase large subunit-like protein
MTPEYIKELKVAKYQCLTSTLFFSRYFFKKRFNRKFVVGEHHRIISDVLDRVISGELKKVIINIAPRYGKTELAVKNFIARGLSINPSARFIHLSYSDDLALDNSDEVRELIKSSEYQEMFPNVKIKPKSDSKKKWYTSEDGGVYATSAAGQVTGFGAGQVDNEDEIIDSFFVGKDGQLFGGALIIDDPIKPEDADSDNIRERVNQRFDSTIRNRVNSRNTPIIIIMQRLHEKDLCGYLIEQEPDEWTVISLPCIKKDGTALWEFKHTVDELNKIKSNNKIVFERQYQQSPKPLEGLMFPENELRYYKPNDLLKFETSIGYADIADEGEDNLSAPVGRNIGKDIYITDVTFCRENTGVTLPLVADMLKRNGTTFIRVESNSMGAMFNRELTKLVPNTKCLPAHSSTNKFTRILMDSEFIKRHCVFIHPSMQSPQYKEFMKELTSYLSNGKSKRDDAPDSMSGLAMFIRAMLPKYYL